MEGRKSEEGNSIAIFVILIAMISSIIFTITQNEVDGSSFAEEISGSYTMMNGDLVIDGDEDFEENENITGNGTKEDPYQISGLDMGEFSIIVKNTDSYLKISKLKLGTNNDDYRMIFYNNDHIIIDNLSVEARFFIDGDFCNELIIRNSYLYTRDSEDFIIYDNIISLNITSSTFQYNRSIGYQKAMVEFYGNFGNTWIYNSTFSGIDLSSQIYGKQILEYCQFKGSILRPRGMSQESEIRYNTFSYQGTSGVFGITRYIDGCNYGSAHNNTFNSMTSGISIQDHNSNAPYGFLIKDNSFNSCEQGISGYQANNFNITSNDFMHCTSSGISMENCDNNMIWRNRFLNCEIEVIGGEIYKCKNKWDFEGCGNYWSLLKGNDTNGDGIFDDPYNISVGNLDRYPVSNRFFDTEQPHVVITSHTSGIINRSYNRIMWEAEDKFGIVRIELISSTESPIDVSDNNPYPIYLEQGTHNISVKATDDNGLFGIECIEVELEKTYPVLNFTTLSEGCFKECDPVPVQWEIVEYFPIAGQNFTIDGVRTTPEPDERSMDLDLDEGPHSISINLTDDLGFEITENVDFIVDRNAPLIEMSGPLDGSEISSSTVNFNCRIIESVGLDSVGYRLDDGDWIEVNDDFSLEKVLDYGDHEFKVEAVDNAGHSTQKEVSFQVRKGNLVNIISPKNRTVFNTDSLDLEWDYVGKFQWSEALLRVGIDKEFISIGTSTDFEMEFPEDGEYQITLMLVDELENFIQSDLHVIRDTKDPAVGFLEVDDVNYINTGRLNINWNGLDNHGMDHYELKIDSGVWDKKGLETSEEIELMEGEHTIMIRAFDLGGNMDEEQIEVIVDVTDPEIEFLEMGIFTSKDIEIEWDAYDRNGIESVFILVEGMKERDVSGSKSHSITINHDGRYLITLKASDLAGNTAITSTTIIVDSMEPRASWIGPSIEITNQTVFELEWEIDEEAGIRELYLTVDGNNIDLDANDTSYVFDLEEGIHTISLTVIDIGGRQYTLDYPEEILIDTTAPAIVFDEKEIYQDGKASLKWTITDSSEGTVTVMISVDGNNFIEIPGTSYSTATLQPGDHTIEMRFTDSAGNQANETWSFTIDDEDEGKDEGSSGLIIVIILIVLVLVIGSVLAIFFFMKKRREKEPEIKEKAKVTVPSRPPGIGQKKIDDGMLAPPPVNQLKGLPVADINPENQDMKKQK